MLIILAIALGASVGSFINVVVDRLPNDLSIVRPRSSCDSCKRTLANFDMVPVLSYLWLRGHCRHCKAAVPLRVFLTEVATSLIFVVLYLTYGFGIGFLVISAMVSLMLVVTLIDLEHGLILNIVIYPAILALLLLSPFWPAMDISREFCCGLPGDGSLEPFQPRVLLGSLFNSLAAGFGAFLTFFVIFLVYPRGMGGGDPKLAGAVGLLVGYPGVFVALWIAVVAGGVLAIFLLSFRKRGRKDAIPFGPFLAVSAIITFMWGSEILAQYGEISANLIGP